MKFRDLLQDLLEEPKLIGKERRSKYINTNITKNPSEDGFKCGGDGTRTRVFPVQQ